MIEHTMRMKQALRWCAMLLVACPLVAAVAQPLNERGWKTYRDDRYAFRYPAGLLQDEEAAIGGRETTANT